MEKHKNTSEKAPFKIRILLIEDDPGDARLAREYLEDAKGFSFELAWADNLSKGLVHLMDEDLGPEDAGGENHGHRFHVVLLDLGLPDSQGLEGIERLHEKAPDTPIIVLTGLSDEVLGVKVLKKGAQDYMAKGEITPALLSRSIRYAVERNGLLKQLEEVRERERRDKEVRSLERLGGADDISVTAGAFGLMPLREGRPEAFNALVAEYGELLDLALEQQAFRVNHGISERLRSMAEDMGFLKAGPRDVVQIHSTVLKIKKTETLPQKARAYIEEGRVVVLELMGYLTSYYRQRAR